MYQQSHHKLAEKFGEASDAGRVPIASLAANFMEYNGENLDVGRGSLHPPHLQRSLSLLLVLFFFFLSSSVVLTIYGQASDSALNNSPPELGKFGVPCKFF
jgi:hypothetical protein